MSTSIITDADLINRFRTGTLFNSYNSVPPPSDAGSGMVVTLSGTDGQPSFVNTVGASGGPDSLLFGFSPATYLVGGDVDWPNIINEIPVDARITKINIVAQADYHVQQDGQMDITNFPNCGVKGSVRAALYLRLSCPNTAFVPTTDNFVNAVDVDTQATFVASWALTASVNNLGLILETEWDIGNDPGQFPLGYITQAQLLTNFTRQQYRFGNGTFTNAAVFTQQWQVLAGTGDLTRPASALYDVNISGWILTITWDFPFSWTLENSSPVEEGDVIDVTSDPLDPNALDGTQIDSVTLEWTDSGGPHSIVVPPILWITITINLFRFRLPPLTGNPQIFNVVITSTQFSGSVTLGKLATIFLVNATGIYTLVPGKTNDTLYDNDNGGDPVDVAIPNPSGDTGFIGG